MGTRRESRSVLQQENKKVLWTVGAVEKRNWISKDVLRRDLDVRGVEQREFRAGRRAGRPEVLSCGFDSQGGQGQNSQREAGFYFVILKEEFLQGTQGRGKD